MSELIRYLCKKCGAESPTGIGYAQTVPGPLPAPQAWCINPHVTGWVCECAGECACLAPIPYDVAS